MKWVFTTTVISVLLKQNILCNLSVLKTIKQIFKEMKHQIIDAGWMPSHPATESINPSATQSADWVVYHDLAGGSSGVLHRHRVVEDQRPQQPDRFPNGELRST